MYKAVLIVCGLTISLFVSAQKKYVGLWEGKLNIGVEMRLIFNIVEEAPDRLTTSMDVPEQGLKGIKVSSTSIVNDSLKIEISQFRASFIGKMENDSLILGSFQQQVSVPIILRKIKQVVEVVKKQTPVPPFPYQSENISYSNASKTISYGATITIPNGKGPFPAVLLLTGSGQQNRDEEMLGHKPFAVIADHLTRNGYVVLRADDRGVGQTTGDPAYATSFDFSRDAIAGIEYLHSRKEVDKSRIGLIGHSEGAMIAQILGAERSDIKYIVSLAGPGSHTATLMSDQNRAIMAKAELPSDHVEAYMSLYDSILQIIIQHDKASFDSLVRRSLNSWIS